MYVCMYVRVNVSVSLDVCICIFVRICKAYLWRSMQICTVCVYGHEDMYAYVQGQSSNVQKALLGTGQAIW